MPFSVLWMALEPITPAAMTEGRGTGGGRVASAAGGSMRAHEAEAAPAIAEAAKGKPNRVMKSSSMPSSIPAPLPLPLLLLSPLLDVLTLPDDVEPAGDAVRTEPEADRRPPPSAAAGEPTDAACTARSMSITPLLLLVDEEDPNDAGYELFPFSAARSSAPASCSSSSWPPRSSSTGGRATPAPIIPAQDTPFPLIPPGPCIAYPPRYGVSESSGGWLCCCWEASAVAVAAAALRVVLEPAIDSPVGNDTSPAPAAGGGADDVVGAGGKRKGGAKGPKTGDEEG